MCNFKTYASGYCGIFFRTSHILLMTAICLLAQVGVRGGERTIDFDREIRPVLSQACFQCHGPDEEQREADLRLDLRTAALADLGGYRAIVPGDLDRSEMYRRITSDDEDQRMPPTDSGHKLSPQQIRLIGQWIQQGAVWKEHWSFIPPSRPRLPRVRQTNWPRNAIDYFVLSRLEREQLTPSNVADRTTLIRRVTLDLTGLPPTPREVEQFLDDPSPLAYERLVGRLLSSPRFGERMALPWLDAARYADTSGYQNDGPRYMWRWRDWVIDALNHNMPFDQFTIEQLAGDMLPGATLNQRIATGFNRNHRGNAEGGIIPEEYAVEYVVDRVDTTSTVWLGLTMACARCHDHKFDPISQREFYQFFAYFITYRSLVARSKKEIRLRGSKYQLSGSRKSCNSWIGKSEWQMNISSRYKVNSPWLSYVGRSRGRGIYQVCRGRLEMSLAGAPTAG